MIANIFAVITEIPPLSEIHEFQPFIKFYRSQNLLFLSLLHFASIVVISLYVGLFYLTIASEDYIFPLSIIFSMLIQSVLLIPKVRVSPPHSVISIIVKLTFVNYLFLLVLRIFQVEAILFIVSSQIAVTLLVFEISFITIRSAEDSIDPFVSQRTDIFGKVARIPMGTMVTLIPFQAIAIILLFVNGRNIDPESELIRQIRFAILLFLSLYLFILTRKKSIRSLTPWFQYLTYSIVISSLLILFIPGFYDQFELYMVRSFGVQGLVIILFGYIPVGIVTGIEIGMLFNQHFSEINPKILAGDTKPESYETLYPEFNLED
jgi:hypothetical protein